MKANKNFKKMRPSTIIVAVLGFATLGFCIYLVQFQTQFQTLHAFTNPQYIIAGVCAALAMVALISVASFLKKISNLLPNLGVGYWVSWALFGVLGVFALGFGLAAVGFLGHLGSPSFLGIVFNNPVSILIITVMIVLSFAAGEILRSRAPLLPRTLITLKYRLPFLSKKAEQAIKHEDINLNELLIDLVGKIILEVNGWNFKLLSVKEEEQLKYNRYVVGNLTCVRGDSDIAIVCKFICSLKAQFYKELDASAKQADLESPFVTTSGASAQQQEGWVSGGVTTARREPLMIMVILVMDQLYFNIGLLVLFFAVDFCKYH